MSKIVQRLLAFFLSVAVSFSFVAPSYALSEGIGFSYLLDDVGGTGGILTCASNTSNNLTVVNLVLASVTGQARIQTMRGGMSSAQLGSSFPIVTGANPYRFLSVSTFGNVAHFVAVLKGSRTNDQISTHDLQVVYVNNYGGSVHNVFDSFFSPPDVICISADDDDFSELQTRTNELLKRYRQNDGTRQQNIREWNARMRAIDEFLKRANSSLLNLFPLRGWKVPKF